MKAPPDLDCLLEASEAAAWLGMSEDRLLSKTKGARPQIPAFRLNQRVIRFHPRTILAKLAKDAGVSPELIAASYGVQQTQPQQQPKQKEN